jgi:hypothetical protein
MCDGRMMGKKKRKKKRRKGWEQHIKRNSKDFFSTFFTFATTF